MRSIHKKPLKRLLSTLLAVVMVLGMVPFTALAAPADVTLEQSGLKATIDPSEPAAVTDGNQSTVTYTVMIEATANGEKNDVKLTIDGTDYSFGTVTVNSSNEITSFANSALLTEFSVITGGKITGAVTKNYAPGDHTVEMSLTVGSTTSDPKTATITVPRKANLTVTATPDEVTDGKDFTVKATSDIADGRVLFEYNGESKYVDVESRLSSGKTIGYAECTFTADDSADTVKATQFNMTGVVNTEANTSITVTAATVYRTITYAGNAVDANNVPAAGTVAHGGTYTVTDAKPNRTGYTFLGWNTNKDADTATYTGTGSETITNVTSDITLYAIWAEETVAITWPTGTITGVTGVGPTPATAVKGSTVTFTVTVTDGYDGSAMVVTANGSPLYGTKGTGNTYTYTFTATAATTVAVAANPTELPVTVKFVRQAADATAVNWPADFTVEKGATGVTIPNQIPTRDGYTFVKWAVGSGEVLPGHNITIAAPGVSADLELRAVWEQDKVDVTYPADVTGVTDVSKNGTESVVKGSLQSFTVTLGTGYDPATLTVTANGVALAPVATGAAGQYQYSFVANADTTIAVSTPSLLQYTVTLPTGENFNALFTAPVNNVTSVTVNYNEGYTFKVAPVGNYTISEVYINGVAKGNSGTYSVASVTGPQTISIVMEAVTFYTVTYVVDGVQLTTRQVQSGTLVKTLGSVGIPTKEGYDTTAWYTDKNYSALVSNAANDVKVTSDMEVYAKYTPKTYLITYDMNAATYNPLTNLHDGGITSTTKTFGQAVALSTTVPTADNYVFKGWATSATGPAVYQPGDSYSTEAAANSDGSYGPVTLYAVWEKKTFTINLSSGVGCSLSPSGSYTVEYGADLTVDIVVERAYAATAPTVTVDGSGVSPTGSTSDNSAAKWSYKLEDITADHTIYVTATKNAIHTVNFYAVKGSTPDTAPFLAQSVEHGYYATQPAAPVIEGYKFVNWYKEVACSNLFNFADPSIKGNTNVYAKYTAITSTVTLPTPGPNDGWTIAAASGSSSPVAYKGNYSFTITVKNGYDASAMQVAANGLALAPSSITDGSDNTKVYTYDLKNITENQTITVVGVARKMITITYNDNGGIGGPGQEQVPMYVAPGIGDEGTITSATPSRVGYTFAKWNTKADGTGTDYAAGANNTFTTDTTLYAVWSAKATTVTLEVSNTTLTNAEYEGEDVTLTATVTSGSDAVTSGSVQFYRANNSSAAELVGTAKVSGGKAVLSIATSAYKRGAANTDSYTVKFIPDEGSGYSEATSSPAVTVTVLSTAISWKLNTSSEVDTKANVLTIKDSSDTEVDSMTAGQEYTLELPKIYALDNQATALVVNKDYKVTWQFCNASGTWEDYTAAAGTNSVKILAEYSQYVFRAVVTPLTGATGHFTKAAVYTDTGALTADSYVESLVTKATNPVAQQDTATTLAVTDTHDLTGGTVAEFEGQEVTLTATVTLSGSTTKVTTGEVYFYNGATLIGKANVQSDGTAVLEATMSTYSAGAKDTFKAVYQDNATYKTSESTGVDVLIRSTAIAWAKDTSGAEVKTLTVTPTGSIYADNQYTLALPTNGIVEDGQSSEILTVGTDYVVSWYMVKADKTVVLLAENTESNTYTVVPPTAGVTYYAVVSPKAGSNYTDAYEVTTTKNFLTSDETTASVKAPTVTTITFGDVKTDTSKTPDFSQYEEKTITITAKVVEGQLAAPTTAKNPEELVKSGTVTFYVVTKDDGTYEKISTATVSDGQATVSYTLPEFALNDGLSNIEYFFAVYSDTAGTYADSNTTGLTTPIAGLNTPDTADDKDATLLTTGIDSNTEAVQILSTSISWKLDTSNTIVAASATTTDANKLKVYAGDTTAASALVSDGKMTAGSTYTLELPAVYALDDAQTAATALTVNKDYTVVWQYREFGASEWQGYPNGLSSDTALITPTYSGYQFQAIVTPIYDNEHLTGYKTAAAYDSSDVATGKTSFLVTDPTEKTELQKTTTTLAITGADKEVKNTVINGTATFTKDHWAQYEGQTVTLTATVKETSTGTPDVESGVVRFYRYVDGTNDAFLGEVALDTNGNAILENVTISAYDTAKVVTENRDLFYAVYVGTDTYETSTSTSDTTTNEGYRFAVSVKYYERVFIKSTAIQTPIIDSALSGKRGSVDNATSTSYTENLTGLLAGVKHTFTLRTGNAAADWSVVALDGRTVASTDYTIQWLVTTGTNEEKAANNETAATFVVNESKSGDKYRVKLVPTADGDMKTGATSNYVVINSLQNVTVEVTASDEIDSTAATDVYQLNNITLTAEVQGKDSQIMPPTGNVTFYYSVNGTNWVEIGTAALALDNVSGTMKATFVTDKLPVDVANGYKQEEVTITAVYAGDETFKASNNSTTKDDGNDSITAGDYVQPDEVTVYSSVVLVHAAEENKAVTSLTNGGIHILANGSLVANETGVALTLQQVYTLDYNIDLSKLVYGTDYTVEWQILENASLYNQNGYYGDTEKWNDIGATGSSYTIGTVPQDAAYRAEITVTNTAPVQGSAQGVQQGAANATTTGRKVYYSNVLVVGAGQATVTTNITTSANTKFNEEGIVAGETVTIHALVAGASNVTPISNLTVTILPQGVTDPALAVFTDELTTVNGYNAFTWDTTGVTPGYYTLTVVATSNNGYAPQTITRTLIVRDNDYTLSVPVNGNSKVYNGKAQGIDWTLTGIDIENALAQKSVVVYYYDEDGKMVEPTQAGTYNYELYLPASAYWTELTHVTGTFTIEKRTVNVVDLVAQAKVYDGTTDINELEVILNDSTVDGDGVATGNNGIINGDSIYATGVMAIDAAGAGTRTLSVSNVTLHGDDANNYTVGSTNYTETINVQRSQVKGDIADSTFKYTGSNITVPADDIYLIDQAGNVLTPADYTVTYYYHNGDGVEKVDAMNKLGKYTVIARPEQNNYKGGASQTVYVVSGTGTDATPTAPTSTLINITNTVELYGATTGIQASATNGATIMTVEYAVNGTFTTVADLSTLNAGRYLVKVTASTGDIAYGIYTIVKARPEFVPTTDAAEVTYNSAPYSGTVDAGFVADKSDSTAKTYITYTGGTIQGIAYEAPTEVGKYIATVHVGETDNYTAHEEQVAFEIKPKALTITADDLARWQYGSYPDMVATFTGLATGGVAADTSLRDVQIQPEFIFNDLNGDGQPEYTNSALDQVGRDYPITVRNALARNYTVTYVAGSYAVNELDPKADLAIHGMIDNGITNPAPVNIAYYGDQIQLYAYGNYKSNGDGTGVYNPSSLLEWSLSAGAPATIDQDGLLTITGVGTFTVTLTRGSGDAAISTSIEITAKPKEVKVDVKDQDKVYNASEQTYNGTVTVEGLINSDTDSATLVAGDKRTNVGSQIVTYKVNTAKYVSETYGGLFTINDKEVTVKPNAASVVYGETLSTLTYTEEGIVTGTPALTNGKAVSIRDSYVNLDVLDGYEILVAGVENMNYNVKYVTDQDAPDAEVTAKPLTFKTGVINSDGRTSGYMKNNSLFYKDEGYAITGTTFNASPNDRMYGEINPVMDYLFDALIADDSEADLVSLLDWLVKYSDGTAHNINGDANVKFVDAHLTGYKSTAYLTGMDAYYIDGMLAADGVKNYTTTVTEATQNIYQRPVTLTPRVTLTAYKPSIIDGSNNVKQDVLLQLLLNNLVVGEYNGKGGLATLLGHTIEDLNIQIVTATYNGTDKIDVTIKLGNTNYWTNTTTFTVNVDPSKIVATYGPLGWTSASVTMIGVDESGNTTGPVNVTGTVTYLIYAKDTTVTEHKYSHYKNLTPVRSVTMTSGGSTGYYIANYDRLSAGDYVMFAIAEGYTIIE